MPKVNKNKSALHKARQLFIHSNPTDSESEDTQSDHSEEYSHVPLKTDIPLLSSLSIDESNMENLVKDIATELSTLTQTLHTIQQTQNQQQHTLNALSQRNGTSENISPTESSALQSDPRQTFNDLFRIPDPIKAIQSFDGNRKQLSNWIQTTEKTLNAFKPLVSDQQFEMYTMAIINKIEGRAKDIVCLAGNPQSFSEIKDILVATLGDRQELSTYKCQLWQNKMIEGVSIQRYYQKTKEIVQNIKIIAKQNQKYRDNWDAICDFIDADALAAFIAGLKEPYFGYAQAARPSDLEDAYAFLCKFRSQEITAQNMTDKHNPKFYKNNNQQFRNEKPNSMKPVNPPLSSSQSTDTNTPKHTFQKIYPMDTQSTNTKLTLNKRQINNNELEETPVDEDNVSASEDETELSINFWQTASIAPKT